MPVLQGFTVREYVSHLDQYEDRLSRGMWVGVGSVCKRQGDIALIIDILSAIKERRPDLRLHGFGVKTTALWSPTIRRLLYSADSMAWSHAGRHADHKRIRAGNAAPRSWSQNDWRRAEEFYQRILDNR